MKKTKVLNQLTRQFLMDQLINSINERNHIFAILHLNDLDAQHEFYIWQINCLDVKIEEIQIIIINNKF